MTNHTTTGSIDSTYIYRNVPEHARAALIARYTDELARLNSVIGNLSGLSRTYSVPTVIAGNVTAITDRLLAAATALKAELGQCLLASHLDAAAARPDRASE